MSVLGIFCEQNNFIEKGQDIAVLQVKILLETSDVNFQFARMKTIHTNIIFNHS